MKGSEKVARTIKKSSLSGEKIKSRPALTPEARENQLIALSMDEAERRIRDGTASSQLLTHFLKLGTAKAQLEIEKTKHENELLKAKTEALQTAKRVEELYDSAIKAMRTYSGHGEEDD